MKRLATIAAAMASVCAMATELNDSVINYKGYKLELSEEGEKLRVDVTNSDGQTLYNTYSFGTKQSKRNDNMSSSHKSFRFAFINHYSNSDDEDGAEENFMVRNFSPHEGSFYIGFNTLIDSDLEPNIARSLELGFDLPSGAWRMSKHSGLSLALGFNWRNIKLDEDMWFLRNGKAVTIEKLPENIELNYSRLRTFSIRFPLMYEWQYRGDNSFFFQVGVIGEITPMVRIKNKYKINFDKETDKLKGLHHNLLGAAIKAVVGYNSFGVYAEYTPTKLFTATQGPEIKTMTVGLTVLF